MFKNKKIIIFDLDGTLIDSMEIWNKVDTLAIEKISKQKCDIPDIGKMRDSVLAKCKSDDIYLEYSNWMKERYHSSLSAREILDLRWNISDYYVKNEVDYKPYAEKLLHLLKNKGFILVLATTTTRLQLDAYRNYNQNIIRKANMDDMFSLILSKEDVKEKKPSSEIYDKILSFYNVEPEQCLVIEDSLIGVMAARNAGIDVVSIYDKASDGDREEIHQLVTKEFSNFEQIIAELKKDMEDY